MTRSTRRTLAGVLTLLMLGTVNREGSAQQATAIDTIVNCIDRAADQYVECVTDAPWWYSQLCLIRYEANAILCVPSMVLPKPPK